MRTDTLADVLGDVLSAPLADPMAAELVVVPARGVERWLNQQLARSLGATDRHDGIAANINFVSPMDFADRLISDVSVGPAGDGGGPYDDSPWRSAALVWRVLEVLDERIGRPDMAILARHLGQLTASRDEAAMRAGRRYGTARHIADLLNRYGRQRPTMLAGWARGEDTDGIGGELPSDMAWQPGFFRAVAERVGTPHPSGLLDSVCAALRADPAKADLPERLSVFGPTRLTASFRSLLDAVAEHREVYLFVPHPSPTLWQRVAESASDNFTAAADAGIDHGGLLARAQRPLPALNHPLLASLSRDVQELQLTVAPIVDTDTHHAGDTVPATLLGTLQADLQVDANGTDATTDLQVLDSTVEIHACHGPERQVEVLRDRLLHLFNADPTLQPRDVIIMCPDVDTFAPLIRGAFGQAGLDHPAFSLRVRLADRGLRFVNPIIDVVATIIDLAVGRVTATDIADLLTRPPVRERFAITEDDVERVRDWLVRSEIRWGIGRTQRARFGLGDFPQGTVDTGLDRIALGVVADERDGQWLGTALPMDGVDSTQIDLFGRVAEFVARLSSLLDDMDVARPAGEWASLLSGAIDRLTATELGEEWQSTQAGRIIAESFSGDGTAPTQQLRAADVRDALGDAIAGRPSRANFRTGELTVCTMVPMRSVPHRVIAMLGVDADSFPRAQRLDGDDVLGRVPLVGERNPRDEDRQLFLDAICAAQERILVCYTGADPVTGARVPPAVVVSELADAAARRCGQTAEQLIVRHPLHGFDRRNFSTHGIGPSGTSNNAEAASDVGQVPLTMPAPFSFDAELAAAARAASDPDLRPATSPIIVADELPAESALDIELSDLTAFFANPAAGYLRQRLHARIPELDDENDEEMSTGVAGLDEWEVGERLVRRQLDGADLTEIQMAELRRGNLPPFQLGQRELGRISEQARAVAQAADAERSRHGAGVGRTEDAVVDLGGNRRVHGSVPDIFGDTMVTATYSKVRAKHRLTAWIRLLVAAAAGVNNGAKVTAAVVVGRADRRGGGVERYWLQAPSDPVAVLAQLVGVRDLGMSRVLPIPVDVAAEYALRIAQGKSTDMALRGAAAKFDGKYGAATDPALRFAYTGDTTVGVPFSALLETPAGSEVGAGGNRFAGTGESGFGALATRVWTPVLEHEVRG